MTREPRPIPSITVRDRASWVSRGLAATVLAVTSLAVTALSGNGLAGCSLIDLGHLREDGAGGAGSSDASVTVSQGQSVSGSSQVSSVGSTSTGSSPSLYAAAVEEDAPLAYYRFDDTDSVAHDEMGSHDGTYMGGAVAGAAGAIVGDPSTCATFDGQTGLVDLGDAFDFAPLSPFTIEAWARADVTPDYSALFEKTARTPRTGYTMLFYPDGRAGIERWVQDTKSQASGVDPTTLGEWHHTVATYSFDGQLRFYLDGTLTAQIGAPGELVDGSDAAVIGAASTFGEFFFTGGIDEVAIYDHALPIERVLAHYALGHGP